MDIQRQADAFHYRVAQLPREVPEGPAVPAWYWHDDEADENARYQDAELGHDSPPSDYEYGPTHDSELPEDNGYYNDLALMLADERGADIAANDPYGGDSAAQLQHLIDADEAGPVDDEEHWAEQRHANFKQAIGIGAPLPGQGQAMTFKPKNYLPNWAPGEQPKRPVRGVNDESDYNFTGSPETQYHHRSIQPGQGNKVQTLHESQDQLYDLMRSGMSFDEAKAHLRIGRNRG